MTPELVNALRAALGLVTISEEPPQTLPSHLSEERANTAQEDTAESDHEQGSNKGKQQTNNYERVKAYLATHPHATDRGIADALTMSSSTANKWRKRVEKANLEGECRGQYA